jgi:hypothetical protein
MLNRGLDSMAELAATSLSTDSVRAAQYKKTELLKMFPFFASVADTSD